MKDLKIVTQFLPVGQGLFSCGVINDLDGGKEFSWIYDCGTLSARVERTRKPLFDAAINNSCIVGLKNINMMVLSHFDDDHITGFLELFKRYRFKYIVLPYIPLWKRLLIAYRSRMGKRSNMFSFYLNPIDFLRNLENGKDVQSFILVLPRDDDFNDLPNPLENKNQNEENDRVIIDSVNYDDVSYGNGPTQFINSGSGMKINNFWEFVFYNDSSFYKFINKTFISKVTAIAETLKIKRSNNYDALIEVKKEYESLFKRESERNKISTFMFSSPLNGFIEDAYGYSSNGSITTLYCNLLKSGVLYTGDGSLKKPVSYEKLALCFGNKRLESICCLQVMHHGSKNNSHDGLAAKLCPEISVFSSDPLKGEKHPHAEVFRDFLKYNPVQVDLKNTFSLIFLLNLS